MGVHITFVRSTQLDKWSYKQLKMMKVGGNGRGTTFFRKHGMANETKHLKKYSSRAAAMYKELIKTEAAKLSTAFSTIIQEEVASLSAPSNEVDFFEAAFSEANWSPSVTSGSGSASPLAFPSSPLAASTPTGAAATTTTTSPSGSAENASFFDQPAAPPPSSSLAASSPSADAPSLLTASSLGSGSRRRGGRSRLGAKKLGAKKKGGLGAKPAGLAAGPGGLSLGAQKAAVSSFDDIEEAKVAPPAAETPSFLGSSAAADSTRAGSDHVASGVPRPSSLSMASGDGSGLGSAGGSGGSLSASAEAARKAAEEEEKKRRTFELIAAMGTSDSRTSFGPAEKKKTVSSVDNAPTIARERFGNATSISSSDFFEEQMAPDAHASRISQFSGASSISSDAYFGRESSASGGPGGGPGGSAGGDAGSDLAARLAAQAKSDISSLGSQLSSFINDIQSRYGT